MKINIVSFLLALFLVLQVTNSPSVAAERSWKARALYRKAVTSNVQLTPDGDAIRLKRGELIEDDGPAAGYSYLPNEEKLSEKVWIKKELIVTAPRAKETFLLVGGRGTFKFLINGTPRQLQSAGRVGNYWQAYSVPPGILKSGTNEIVVHGSGKIWIARDDEYAAGSRTRRQHPNRSAKSTDGGRTWDYERLGTEGNVDGEYYVRLFLDRFRKEGSLLLQVVDAGNLAGKTVAPPLMSVGPVRIKVQATTGTQGSIAVRYRTGATPHPNSKHWSEWQKLSTDGVVEKPGGRYLQMSITLKTGNPLDSPRLHEISVEARADASGKWVEHLKVLKSHNEEIVKTSIPFEYARFDHPQLKRLRDEYNLDRVVEGVKTEFELITRLAEWSSRQWSGNGHLAEDYPPWDALEILKQHADGAPVGGFCQQYNLVFLQACESFGLVGRAVSLGPGEKIDKIRGGHEVVEIWSNEYKKWVYVDGQMAWHFRDEASGMPLSLWELRRRQLAAFRGSPHPSVEIVHLGTPRREWKKLTDWPPFVELRLIPRSNFLQKKSPLPLNQGMRGWFWTGHYVWTDSLEPARKLYSHRISNRDNWEWTLNQARYILEATERPGVIRVHLETETPHFESFLAEIDGSEKSVVQLGFLWKLHPGTNRLKVRPRNTAGREGIASWIVLGYEE